VSANEKRHHSYRYADVITRFSHGRCAAHLGYRLSLSHPRCRLGTNTVGSIVFVDSLGQLLYVKVPASIKHVPIGKDVWFSVRADLMNTGDKQDMANRIEGKYIASEFLGSLETDVFEVAPGHYIHVEQHRHAQDHVYKMGDRETLCWHAESGVLLENSRRPDEVEAV
jgi:hypothetical protein